MDVPEMGYLHTDSWHGGDPRVGGGGGQPCTGRGEVLLILLYCYTSLYCVYSVVVLMI
jgi:hypothetical protein